MDLTKNKNIIFLAVISTFLWGCAPSFIKVGYQLLNINSSNTASLLMFAGIRFTLAGILVIIMQSILKKKVLIPSKSDMKPILVLALFQTFGQYFFYYLGVARTSGVNASIISGSGALIALLFAVYLFKSETMNKQKLIACIMGFGGILCMNLGQKLSLSFTGDCLCMMSQLCYSLSSCFINKFTKEHNAVLLSGYQFFIGGLSLFFLGKGMGGLLHFQGLSIYLVIFYLACISAIAYTLWGLLLSCNPVGKIGVYGCLTPIFGVIVSAVVLKEIQQAMSIQSIFALVLIVFAIFIMNKEKRL
ncbi:MAG: DMT family transporter [Erysipelotrichaceae bacterium]|uniref:DMT family transporter n=1 Tax=Floccifex sp. TaxID=2815810 RepID=UPI002A757AD1|nr:DMT family transporter [Floccifex sp.]MDD7280977.1 DMT family transporter [Erysipelotrichaceae bacterium]MDY2958470.1 DMT family transporter [Floccifex sp.]